MKCSIVYLDPVGAGGFRAPLRSDTLWGALCWAIRMVKDEKTLIEVLNNYAHNPDGAFYLSSAFPYETEEDGKMHFFPAPLRPANKPAEIEVNENYPEETKLDARNAKKIDKLPEFLPKSSFEYLIKGARTSYVAKKNPVYISRPMTHNTIDRLSGSTLKLNDSGQLFHTEEQYLKGENTGFYFLLKGNLEYVKPALRFLEHNGIGGDRSTGKGRYKISEPEDFEVDTPTDANAVMTLSLYHPIEEELIHWKKEHPLLNYQLEDRRGRTHLQSKYLNDQSLIYFKEGSVFPIINDYPVYGKNQLIDTHTAGFKMQRYGYGFMVNVKIQ